MKNKKREALLNGSIGKSIFLISTPIIFANILQTVYQLIDTYWVGRLGGEAVAAVSLSFPIMFFIISLAMGFTMAGSILIAQYNGKKDDENVSLATGQTFTLVSIVAIIFSFIGYYTAPFLLSYLTKDPLVFTDAVSYLQISFSSMLSMFIFTVFQSALRGVGEVKFPMMVVLITVVMNFFLDPILMLGWKGIPALGVAGVAYATLITQTISAIIGIFAMVFFKYDIKMRLKDFKLKKEWAIKIIKLGLPSSLEQSSRSFGMFLMTFMVSTFGTIAIAAFGIGLRVLMFIIIPAIGFSIATSTLVGNNLGANQNKRAEEISNVGIKIGFYFLTAIGIITFVFARQLVSFFIPNEVEIINSATLFIRYISISFGFIGVQMAILGTLKGAGKTTVSMFLAISQTFTLFVIGYMLSVIGSLGILGIWISYPVANFIALIIAWSVYQRSNWTKSIV